ncbi:MAG: hypothetical protein DGJ47_000244 [Rickettsiaceae bacterium]
MLFKHFNIKPLKTCLLFAFFHALLFNSTTYYYHDNATHINITNLLQYISYNTALLLVIFYGLSVHRIIFISGAIALFIFSSLASYYLFFFSVVPNISVIASIFNTDMMESSELVSAKLLLWVAFCVIICLILIYRNFSNLQHKNVLSRTLSLICLILFTINIINPYKERIKNQLPFTYLHNTYLYLKKSSQTILRTNINDKFSFSDTQTDILGVLIIGESARYDHFSINGYERLTTPLLSKLDNLVSFKARSCASNTADSVPCMISRYGEDEFELIDSESSLFPALNNLGYQTIWIGNQSIAKHLSQQSRSLHGNVYDDLTTVITPDMFPHIKYHALDRNLLPYLENSLSDKHKKFITLHTSGSHWNYAKRYDDEFAKFRPHILNDSIRQKDASNCSHDELVNSYDNSIYYTDSFIHEVIERVKDRVSFVIYSSDHGESLGENGCFFHSSEEDIKEQREVPFIIWVSEKYKKAYPQKWLAIKEAQDNFISHDHLYHTILGCLGIESDSLKPHLDLSDKQ